MEHDPERDTGVCMWLCVHKWTASGIIANQTVALAFPPSPILHGPSLLSEHDRHSSVSCDCRLAQRSRVKCYKVKGLSDGVSHAVPADAAVLAKGDEE